MRGVSFGLTVGIHEALHAGCCMDIELLGPSKKNCGKPSLARFVIFRKYFLLVCITYYAPLQLGWTETARSGSLKQWQRDRNFPGIRHLAKVMANLT